MDKEVKLYIEFSKSLSEKEQNEFWNEIVELIESIDLLFGGGNNSSYLDCVIDCRNSKLEKGEIIDTIGDFLIGKEDLILSFKLE